jgi:hypothetical protein
MGRLPTFEVLLHIFMRSFHLEERNIETLLAWDFEASTSLFPWNVELGEKIGPILCGMFLSHGGFVYMWHLLIMD